MKYMILITEKSNNRCWYDEHVGEEFPALELRNGEWKTRCPYGYINFVNEKHCVLKIVETVDE